MNAVKVSAQHRPLGSFDPGRMAGLFREMSSDLVTINGKTVTLFWYSAGEECDFFIWLRGKHIIKQRLYIYGSIAEWDLGRGVRTGVLIEVEQKSGKFRDEYFYDKIPNPVVLKWCHLIINGLTVLETEKKERVVKHFSQALSVTTGEARSLELYTPKPHRFRRMFYSFYNWLLRFHF